MLPILVLCFARLDTLRQTLESILSQPHGSIYVSCDGPLLTYQSECAEVRDYVQDLMRMGVIQYLRISDINEGTLVGVSKGIDWFFEKEKIGIILEDDLVLEPCLLEAVEIFSNCLSDESVVSIGLHNRVPEKYISNNNKVARRSSFVISCGWVTTQKAWNDRLTSFGDVNYFSLFFKMTQSIGLSSSAYHLWFYLKQRKQEGRDIRKCNWDDLWQINCFMKNKSVAAFNRNLITNIGNGVGSTHTFGKSLYADLKPILQEEFIDPDFWNLPSKKDNLSDQFFKSDRKVITIFKEKIRIRTRLRLKK